MLFFGGGEELSQNCEKQLLASYCPSVRMEQLGSQRKLSYCVLHLKICRENVRFFQNQTVITGTLHEDQNTFFIISLSVLLRMRNVSVKSCTENQNTYFVFSNFPPLPPQNRAIYEIMWKNIVERGRPQMTIWRVRILCWLPKATNQHTEYVILIVFPL